MRLGLMFVGVFLAAAAQAQEPPFPQKGTVEITVLFPAGSSADVTARLLADGMSKNLGAKVVVFNRPGAGGAIGYKHVASQKPDGYSIVWNSNSISTTFHSGMLPFDYHAFDAVARVLVESPVIAVKGDSKWKTLADLVAEAKSRPKGITVGIVTKVTRGNRGLMQVAEVKPAVGLDRIEEVLVVPAGAQLKESVE